MCDENACTYDDARICDDPNCASNFAGRDSRNHNSYVPIRNDVVACSWKKHWAGVAALIGIAVVVAICIVVATRPEETGGDLMFGTNKAGVYIQFIMCTEFIWQFSCYKNTDSYKLFAFF